MEYKKAWEYFVHRRIKKVLVLFFDSRKPAEFQRRKTAALNRFGMGLIVSDRTFRLYSKILSILSKPIHGLWDLNEI